MEAVASRSEAVSSNERLTFADTWEDVHLSYVPLQPDEAGYGGEVILSFDWMFLFSISIIAGRN